MQTLTLAGGKEFWGSIPYHINNMLTVVFLNLQTKQNLECQTAMRKYFQGVVWASTASQPQNQYVGTPLNLQ